MYDSEPSSEQLNAEGHWRETRLLMWISVGLWALFAFVAHLFASSFNHLRFLGFPLGYYMAAQGSLIAFVLIIFWHGWRQNAIDEAYGVAE